MTTWSGLPALGLAKAVDGYDPGLGTFVGYAVRAVRGELTRHVPDEQAASQACEPAPTVDDASGWLPVRPALDHLPPAERDVLVMRFFLSMTPERIAERVGVPESDVSGLLAGALRGLRARIEGRPARSRRG